MLSLDSPSSSDVVASPGRGPRRPWLRLRFLLAPEAPVGAFPGAWPPFLQKLSIPITPQISLIGDWIGQNLPVAATTLFNSEPRTLIHNDVQADNFFFVRRVGTCSSSTGRWRRMPAASLTSQAASGGSSSQRSAEPPSRNSYGTTITHLLRTGTGLHVRTMLWLTIDSPRSAEPPASPPRSVCLRILGRIPAHSGTRCFLAIRLIDGEAAVSVCLWGSPRESSARRCPT